MRAKRTSRGETLVETLAAILVVSLTSVFLLTSVMAAQRVNRQAGEGDEQLRLEQDVVERRSDGKQSTVQIGGGSPLLTTLTVKTLLGRRVAD